MDLNINNFTCSIIQTALHNAHVIRKIGSGERDLCNTAILNVTKEGYMSSTRVYSVRSGAVLYITDRAASRAPGSENDDFLSVKTISMGLRDLT